MSDKLYGDLYRCPPSPGSPVVYDYARHQEYASKIRGYVKIKVDVGIALNAAKASPYPDAVKVAVMKQVSNTGEITLQQLRILLGWAAQKAQGVNVALRNNYQSKGWA